MFAIRTSSNAGRRERERGRYLVCSDTKRLRWETLVEVNVDGVHVHSLSISDLGSRSSMWQSEHG
jgi:hypothetical protein